ncbi:hypothetical protein L2Y96_10260 [Luteibacter aegosomaticola]|uniref:hypothetical protein n=1 Tax=Luteibacter aegosomaticola TaxID=2911538 RepID=UPI001FFB19AB|nr:hypothetical protein [Luteibacter aegosomaticola]UPG92124.1 hypothetical protein L2Y96_10260 [Luteibacter aegosomaticola]
MTRNLACLAISLATLTATACASPQPRAGNAEWKTPAPFTLVNATAASVTTLALAPGGTADFATVDLGGAVQGGLTSATFRPAAGPCVRDMQVTFADQRSTVLTGIDVCRTHGLRLDHLKGGMNG